MRYLVCDTDGALHDRTAADYRRALDDVGPEGSDRISLPFAQMMFGPGQVHIAAFVNDCGHLMPEKYGRNVVASCLLASIGAGTAFWYAGPVVFTGWDAATGGVEVRGLTDEQVESIAGMHADVRRLLGIDPGPLSPLADQRWQDAIRAYAEFVRSGPVPSAVVLTGDEALAHLRAMRGAL